MSNAASETNAGDRTVRDLVQKEYRRHQLRRGILDHAHLDTPIETAILNRDEFLRDLSKLPNVGAKAIGVISDLLDQAEMARKSQIRKLALRELPRIDKEIAIAKYQDENVDST